MNQRLVHRGPDDEGVYTAGCVGLGQRRLSIIDLRPVGAAPLSNEDGSVWAVLNGEIYNFRELRRTLEQRGHVFKSQTDTEVLVHLFEDHGEGLLRLIQGMFALAVWDSNNKRLLLARDRLGKKPLVYARTQGELTFASEIRGLLEATGKSREPDLAAIDAYLAYQYVPSPRTAFRGVQKLEPAHYIVFSADGDSTKRRYWSPGEAQQACDLSRVEAAAELRARLRGAVRARLFSDVSLGASLSGGLDSASIVAMMAQETTDQVQTFSIGFREADFDETAGARLVSQRYRTNHHEIFIRPDAFEILDLLTKTYNEPFADTSAIPSFFLAKLARSSVTVVLSGDGGDEALSGYERYGRLLRWGKLDLAPRRVRRLTASGGHSLLRMFPRWNLGNRLSRGLDMLHGSAWDRYRLEMSVVKPQEKQLLYSPEFKHFLKVEGAFDPAAQWPLASDQDPVHWMMNHDQRFYLPDCLMVKTDMASMAHGLEVRCPFLDTSVLDFTASLPGAFLRSSGTGKLLLREAMQDLVPSSTLTAPKKGFSVPISKWLRGELRHLLGDTLLSDTASARGLFDPSAVRRMVVEHQEKKRDWGTRLWTLLSLELWFRHYIDA